MGELVAEPAIVPRRHQRADDVEVRIARRVAGQIGREPVAQRRVHRAPGRGVEWHGDEIGLDMPRRQQRQHSVEIGIEHRQRREAVEMAVDRDRVRSGGGAEEILSA